MAPTRVLSAGYCCASRAAIGTHLGLRLLERHAGFHARDHFEVMAGARRRFRQRESQRNPELLAPVGHHPRQLHGGRHHADDDVAFAVEVDRPTDNARVGTEAPLP